MAELTLSEEEIEAFVRELVDIIVCLWECGHV